LTETLEKNKVDDTQKLTLPDIVVATDGELIAYLRYSHKVAELASLAERDAIILFACGQLGIEISDDELQEAGDAFRQEHRLFGSAETLRWFQQQRINVEDWTQGIRIELLTKKLKEHLFGENVDSHYLNNRDDYKRVALSQILVSELTDAMEIARAIQKENASFCAMAIERSKAKQSRQNGGFVGINFMAEIMPEIKQAIAELKEGEVTEPIQTKIGFHIVKIEKWYPPEMNDSVRSTILDLLFKSWLGSLSDRSVRIDA
jgi:parvulin-like peptidyl-prolyl isomerase